LKIFPPLEDLGEFLKIRTLKNPRPEWPRASLYQPNGSIFT